MVREYREKRGTLTPEFINITDTSVDPVSVFSDTGSTESSATPEMNFDRKEITKPKPAEPYLFSDWELDCVSSDVSYYCVISISL